MSFAVYRPSDLADALAALQDPGVRPVAGGTDLVIQLRAGRRTAAKLVPLEGLGLDRIEESDGALRIGAMTRLVDVVAHASVQASLPALVDACVRIGSPQIQAVATLGGNLGNASPAADSVPPLMVYGASVETLSSEGGRAIPLTALFAGPGRTTLAPGEIIAALHVPLPATPDGTTRHAVFRKYGPRRANVISAVTFAAALGLRGRSIEDAVVALGSVGPTPLRASRTESWLMGRDLEQALRRTESLASAVQADIAPISDVRGGREYKTQLALNSVRFALASALEGGGA